MIKKVTLKKTKKEINTRKNSNIEYLTKFTIKHIR